MKIWQGYGSEHSYRLVLIGRFANTHTAQAVAEKMSRLTDAASATWPDDPWERPDERLDAALRDVLYELELYDLARSDVDNFAYEHSIDVDGDRVRIATDEGEIQGFLKVFINAGAKVEVYSGHNWNDDGTPATRHADDTDGPADEPET